MNPPIPVTTLTPMTNTDVLRVHGRPVRIWPAQDARFGRVYSMAFLFVDHTGGKIQGIIPVPEYQRLSNVFSEEHICEISRFTVESSTIDYQVVKHPYILSLTRQTLITTLQPNIYDIPRNYFQFGSFEDLGVTVTHLKAVMDVIARLVGFGDIVHRNTGPQTSRVQGMYLTDNRGKTIEVALWGDHIDYFNIPEIFERSKEGIYSLKTYSGTRFFMDPSIKEIADYLAVTPYDGNPITLRATSETYNIHPTSLALQRTAPIKMTIAQLNSLYLDAYNIRVQVVDHTGSAQFVLLGRLGEAAVGMTAQALAALQQQTNNNIPDQLRAIVRKKYLFTVAGKQRVAHQENRPYTVVSMLEVPLEMLALLPQPVLDHEVGILTAGPATLTQNTEPHTPPHPSPITPSSPHTSTANLLTYHSPAGATATSDDVLKDARGKRPLANEEDAPELHMKNVKRKLEFDDATPDNTHRSDHTTS
ncbi:Replication factor-A carboxy-terminal domain protein [Rhynchospora pubera]|uniref:Replication factor-A carboxy-terminal domain protein n=1 Tax=Rhynchospora pubera TaxID=906938 RepID=A0AAV8DFU3_9POAL|nr:Replication factor-A carboxy-terminal domain protein [Rhynchospora pubera]